MYAIVFLSLSLFQGPALALPTLAGKLDLRIRAPQEPGLPTQSLPISTVYLPIASTVQVAQTDAPTDAATILTSLETNGRVSALPFTTQTVISVSTQVLSVASSLQPSFAPTSNAKPTQDAFLPIATGAPPSQFTSRNDHPVKQLNIVAQGKPVQTNKFYANLFLGSQHQGVWTHPYSVNWGDGTGNVPTYGLIVTHVDDSRVVFGPPNANPPGFYVNPIGVKSISLSAVELGSSTTLTTGSHQAFSVNAYLATSPGNTPVISFPLVQGMGFVTGVYTDATVLLESGVYFSSLVVAGKVGNSGTYKYRIGLQDGTNWLMYATPTGASGAPPFNLANSSQIIGPQGFSGVVQIAKNPLSTDSESYFDQASGAYPVGVSITGNVQSKQGTYSLKWTRAGRTDASLLTYLLPHHVDSLDPSLQTRITPLKLRTSTKGTATGFLSDTATMVETQLPTDVGFEPWSSTAGTARFVSQQVTADLYVSAAAELAQNITAQSYLDSMYYSGKALSKFATIIYATQDLAGNAQLAASALARLKDAFASFVNNQQPFPLVYDAVWRGATSSATYVTGDSGVDFGNSLYNDHQFHYGYFVHAASIIGYLDPSWLQNANNKAWVNTLVRDFANSVGDDSYFPFSRSFDWFHGHSWAKGLFESADGKDEESSSEDAFAAYAVKMWAKVIGDSSMEARANLQLAVMRRSLQSYFLMESNNQNQPAQFVPNQVSGILFENKVDHTTYFGNKPSYVEGIHMIPISPISAYIRSQNFVQQEWNAYFSNGRAASADGPWRSILMSNLAIVNPASSYAYFSNQSFDYSSLDGGASRTWYLAYAAGLGGA